VAEIEQQMTLRIDKVAQGDVTTFVLSGRLDAEHIEELKGLLKLQPDPSKLVLDLKQTRLVDRDGIAFLARCEAAGIKLANCPAYVREWMQKEGIL
jgi:hypothetical protein